MLLVWLCLHCGGGSCGWRLVVGGCGGSSGSSSGGGGGGGGSGCNSYPCYWVEDQITSNI